MDAGLLRMIDANANRAREGLRVVEDYARFVLDDVRLQADLKALRHDLSATLSPILPDAALHRDTPGDVGTTAQPAASTVRSSLNDVVTAAGKRLGEALRAVEESLKVVAADRAATVERLRYRFYDIEHRIARTLRPVDRFASVRLYVLITERSCRRPWLEAAEAAIDGGAECLQLREKELDGGELLHRARQLVELCRRRGALCIINDRADIATLSGADGVHVGQTDLSAVEARKIVGDRAIIGVSTHAIEQARQAVLDGADYLGVGPVYRSETKPREILPGLAYAEQAAREIARPCVAIGGITPNNVDAVRATGVQAVAVTAAVVGQADAADASRALRAKLDRSPV